MFRRAGIALLGGVFSACSISPAPPQPAAPMAPLYDNLGNYHRAVTTRSPEAQQYFDQGMTLSYAFNHAEAIRAFEQGVALDPQCAMCYWGIAFALGPNINAPITEEAAKGAWEAIGKARGASARGTDEEQALIDALAVRYAADPKADRAPLDKAYASAMRQLAGRFPDDSDVLTLFAQSLMDTAPWNYWNPNGTPREFTGDVLAALESVLARHPEHIGAIHLYIHAVEASPDPKRAEPYADRLAALVPGAGHLVHMPGHIYLRTGRYHDASLANDNGVKADEAYFRDNPVPGNMTYRVGYATHNFHFFVTSASLEGRRADAIRAAELVRSKAPADMMGDPGMGGMVQHMWLSPLYTRMWFGLWEDVLAEPAPPADLPFLTAIWHMARGRAFLAGGKLQEAMAEHAAMAAARSDPTLQTVYVSSVNTAAAIVAIADEVLAGEIDTKAGRVGSAIAHFAKAVELEDGLIYMEPPDWPVPVRQLQGVALLELGRAAAAEAAFRGDMRKFPENGWSLSGLEASLTRQGKTQEAAEVKARLSAAWIRADIPVAAGRVASR